MQQNTIQDKHFLSQSNSDENEYRLYLEGLSLFIEIHNMNIHKKRPLTTFQLNRENRRATNECINFVRVFKTKYTILFFMESFWQYKSEISNQNRIHKAYTTTILNGV